IITPIRLKDVNAPLAGGAFTVLDATLGGEFTADGKDFKTLIILKGIAAAATVSVNAGNGPCGVNKLVAPTNAGADKYSVFTLDSAAFKNIHGPDKGKVIMLPSAQGIEAMVVVLP
ncbi:MAG: hypothetical protein RR315_09010, partial [Oscillospiraceae bacterium]